MTTAHVIATGNDDTTLVQQAVNDLTTSGGTVYLDGDFFWSSLDVTKRHGLTLTGDGAWGTTITPITASNSVIDISGSFGITLEKFSLGASGQTLMPGCAILMLQTKNNCGNRNFFHDLQIDGSYMVASIYNYGVASSYMIGCALWNYRNVTNQRTFALYLGSDNFDNFGSPYLPTDGSGYSVAEGGGKDLIDWDFFHCELHAQRAGGGFANSAPLRMRGARACGFSGGNMEGSGYALVTMESDNTGRETYCPTFHKVCFAAEIGPSPQYIWDPCNHVYGLEAKKCVENYLIGAVTHPELLSNFDHT